MTKPDDSVDGLLAEIRREAERTPFPIDQAVYERAGKDPLDPILFAGSLEAPLCVFGRDLGKDEVAQGQPQVGAAGRLVRLGLVRAFTGSEPAGGDRLLESALDYAILSNTVPYKPPGNKAYPEAVKARFRPFIARLLMDYWRGDRVLTLGTEAFQWFARYAEPGAADALWEREDRYELELTCHLVAEGGGASKSLVLCPLPHPSPLNQRWYAKFPDLLAARLARLR